MRIESLHIDRFGKLRGFSMQLEDGLTLVHGLNESGKSTLMAFIRAMLYGLNGKSASISQNDRKKYMPWGETSMGGSLRLTDGRTVWEIARVFGQTKKQDTCRVVDVATGEIIELAPGDEPGRVLLGVDETVFAGTLYVPAGGSRPEGDGASLTEKIKNLIGTGVEDVDLRRVVERLRAARSAVAPRVRDRGSLAAVRAEMDEVRAKMVESARSQQEAERLRARVQELSKESESSGQQALRARLDERSRLAQRLKEYRQQAEELAERIQTLEQQVQVHEAAPAAGSQVMTWMWLGLALVTAVLSVAAGLLWSNYAFAGLVVTAGLCVLYMRSKDHSEAAPAGQAQEEQIERQLAAARREHVMYIQQQERLVKQIDALDQVLGKEVQPAGEDHQEELVAARVQLETLMQKCGDPEELRKRLDALERKENALLRRAQALEMAENELMQAARERQSGFVPELTQRMERILSRVTAGKYARAAVSQSLELSLQPEEGALQPWDYFSGGTVELMYLAMRLALMQMLEKHGGSLPALLDDPLVLFDDARCRTALDVLREAGAAGQQVLLFTCQDRTVQLSGGARVVEMAQ